MNKERVFVFLDYLEPSTVYQSEREMKYPGWRKETDKPLLVCSQFCEKHVHVELNLSFMIEGNPVGNVVNFRITSH